MNIRVSGASLAARQSVLAALQRAHERFSSREETARATGNHVLADESHRYALWTLRAYRAELDDREPKEPA